MRKRLEHLPSSFSDLIIVNGLISTAAVIVTHLMYKVCLYVFSPKCVLRSPWSFLEMTQVSPWQDPMSEVLKRLFPPLSFSDLSQSLVHSLPLLVTPDQGGSVCGTEEADPRKGAALHTDSIQLHSAVSAVSPWTRRTRRTRRQSSGSVEARVISKRPPNQLRAQC